MRSFFGGNMINAELMSGEKVTADKKSKSYLKYEFYGDVDLVDSLYALANMVATEKDYQNAIMLAYVGYDRKENILESLRIKSEMQEFRRKHVFWMLSGVHRDIIRTYKEKLETLNEKDIEMTSFIKKVKRQMVYQERTKSVRVRKLLGELGFQMNRRLIGSDGVNEEFYVSTLSDDELKSLVDSLTCQFLKEQTKNNQRVSSQFINNDIQLSDDVMGME